VWLARDAGGGIEGGPKRGRWRRVTFGVYVLYVSRSVRPTVGFFAAEFIGGGMMRGLAFGLGLVL
jgi:hypothetical protein